MNSAVVEDERPLVVIVDDDVAVRTSIEELMLSVGIDATAFASTRELLDAPLPKRPGCFVLDVRMPGRAVSTFSIILPRPVTPSRSSSSPATATFRCPSRR